MNPCQFQVQNDQSGMEKVRLGAKDGYLRGGWRIYASVGFGGIGVVNKGALEFCDRERNVWLHM